MMTSLSSIKSAQAYSHKKLEALRKEFDTALASDPDASNFSILTCGSYARGEASKESDIDYCVIFSEKNKEKRSDLESKIAEIISEHVDNPHGNTGTFGGILYIDDLLRNIGGEKDTNKNLTKRILIFLEGTYLFNEHNFKDYQQQLLKTYIKESVQEHQLPKFLLNDVIRYYRTLCTDFEYKTAEDRKPWGIRNIKLVFSRKLLYFSGLIAIADLFHRTREDKINRLEFLFNLNPIERIQYICGDEETLRAMSIYDNFLKDISDPETRNHLKTIVPKNKDDEIFRKIKNDGHRFSYELTNLLSKTFDSNHPIHHSLIM